MAVMRRSPANTNGFRNMGDVTHLWAGSKDVKWWAARVEGADGADGVRLGTPSSE